jgi:hypothetical protein
MGFVKDFKDLMITRIFLGITEAGELQARATSPLPITLTTLL